MPYDDRLFTLLGELDDHELKSIWETALKRKAEYEDYARGSREYRIACISKEWRAVHGHSLRNLARGSHDLPWKRILIDVADKLKPGVAWTAYRVGDEYTEQEIEDAILGFVNERIQVAWDRMSESERETLAQSVDEELSQADRTFHRSAKGAGARHVTVSSLGAAITAGLLTAGGLTALAQGTTAYAVGGLLFSGTLSQLGLWVVVRLFGVWTGAQMAASGGLATVGAALVSLPAFAVFGANAVMSTAYRKTVPATVMLLTAHELRRQFQDEGNGS